MPPGTAIIDELGDGAHAHRQADLLHLGRQRAADRRARGDTSDWSGSTSSAAIARRLCDPLQDRPGHRAALRRRRPRAASSAPRNRQDFAIPPPDGTILDRAARRGPRGRHGRQDRRHLRPPRHGPGGEGARATWRCSTRCSPRPEAPRRRRPRLRQFRRFRHASSAIAATSPAMPRRSRPSTARLPELGGAAAAGRPRGASPPTTATTRPGAAPTIRASTCRSWPSGRGCAGADRPARDARGHRRDRRRASRPAGEAGRDELALMDRNPSADLAVDVPETSNA